MDAFFLNFRWIFKNLWFSCFNIQTSLYPCFTHIMLRKKGFIESDIGIYMGKRMLTLFSIKIYTFNPLGNYIFPVLWPSICFSIFILRRLSNLKKGLFVAGCWNSCFEPFVDDRKILIRHLLIFVLPVFVFKFSGKTFQFY